MKYYEIRDMNEPTGTPDGYMVRIIDEDELDRRINWFRDDNITLHDCKQYLLHGKVKEADPWEEWAEIVSQNTSRAELKAALLKLRHLVEKKD